MCRSGGRGGAAAAFLCGEGYAPVYNMTGGMLAWEWDTVLCSEPEGFLRGDSNDDEGVDIADAIYVLNYLFGGGGALTCEDAADANDDGAVDISDAISILGFLFDAGGLLPEPFGSCGTDPTDDLLECSAAEPCE